MERTDFARHLRRSQTEAEALVWSLLRRGAMGCKFKRQVVRGPYVLDFACCEARLAVELDGEPHALADRDSARNRWLRERGWRVLRVWNEDVLRDVEAVRGMIRLALEETPSPGSRP